MANTEHVCDDSGKSIITISNPKPGITKTEIAYTCSQCGVVTRATESTAPSPL